MHGRVYNPSTSNYFTDLSNRHHECVNVLDVTNVFGRLDEKEYPLTGGPLLHSTSI